MFVSNFICQTNIPAKEKKKTLHGLDIGITSSLKTKDTLQISLGDK
jgi:hypothetical protein